MSFAIELLPDQVPQSVVHTPARWGSITIGSFQERFIVPVHYWNATDYGQHWKQALSRLIGQSDRSCLITAMYEPQTANFIHWWPLYRSGNTVFIQNHILFLNTLSTPFDPKNPFSHVPRRETVNKDSDRTSEWHLPMEDLVRFLQK